MIIICLLQKWKQKRARTVSSMLASNGTVRRRLTKTLGIIPIKNNPSIIIKPQQSVPHRPIVNDRYNAFIPQVSLFGENLGLEYSPPG